MNQINRFILLIILILFIQNSYSQQTVILHIPQAIEIDAGSNVTTDQFDQVTLGGSPTAQGGLLPYQYSWTPVTFLDDPTSPNPIATPEDTITYTLEVIDANGCSVSSQTTINVITIGMNEISNKYDITIYPNPSSGIVNIDFNKLSGDFHISILDLNGKLFMEDQIYIVIGSSQSLDIKKYPTGSYILQIRGRDFIINRSIIKE